MSNIVQSNKDNWLAIKEQAEAVKKAGLLPAAMTSEQAAIIVLKGQELGIGTMRALEGLYVVNGKIGMSANLAMGLIRERCPKAKIIVKRKDNKGCIIEAERPGQSPETFQFLEADANAAGLIKPGSPWQKYASNMYWSRCVTQMGRQLFSDVLGAAYSPEELGGDHHEEPDSSNNGKDVTPIAPIVDQINQRPINETQNITQTKGASVSSLNERLQSSETTMAVTVPPKLDKKVVDVETGEVKDDFPLFEDFEKEEVSSENPPNCWERVASSGPNSGKTLKQIFQEVGKPAFIQMYKTSTDKIAKMNKEGKIIPQNTFETYVDLELCIKELGVG